MSRPAARAKRSGEGGGGGAAGEAGVYLRAEVRALDAQLDAGGALELGLAAATVRLAHTRLHRRHAAWPLEERLTEEEGEEGGRNGWAEGGQGRGERPRRGRSSDRQAWAREEEEERGACPEHVARPAPAPRAQLAPPRGLGPAPTRGPQPLGRQCARGSRKGTWPAPRPLRAVALLPAASRRPGKARFGRLGKALSVPNEKSPVVAY